MPVHRLLIVTALVAVCAGFAGAAEAAKTCKVSVTGPTVRGHPTRITAEVAAATLWSTKVADVHTLRFANWQNAEASSFSCSRYTTVIGINAWRCRARAKPCAFQ
ncbi:MAG: hypothetical protein WDZ83_02165 [Rhizobiaceae bacterium]